MVSIRRAAVLVLGAGSLFAAACSGGSTKTTVETTQPPVSTTSTTVLPRGDGPLRLGVLLPQTGANSVLGQSLAAAVELAVKEIDDAGGVNGRAIIVERSAEPSDISAAIASLDNLVNDRHVDAVIGPASGRTALAAIDAANQSHVVMCSPTAANLALSSYAGNRYFFRTMPADDLEALALARALISSTGARATSLVYADNDYGNAMANLVVAELRRNGVNFTAAAFQPGADSLHDTVLQALGSRPQAIAVIGSADEGAAVLAELRTQGVTAASIPTFVTSAMRQAGLFEKVAAGRPDVMQGVVGVSPEASPVDPVFSGRVNKDNASVAASNFASYAYDCTNLIALAAQAAGSNDPTKFVDQVAATSRVGFTCQDFATCARLLAEQRDIDYDGQSGTVELNGSGDVDSGRYDVFTFDPQGRDVTERMSLVTR